MRKLLCVQNSGKNPELSYIQEIFKNTIYTFLDERPMYNGRREYIGVGYELVETGRHSGYAKFLFVELPDIEMNVDEIINEAVNE